MLIPKILLSALFLTSYFSCLAQVSFGYANSDYVLTSHPLYKQAIKEYDSEQAAVAAEFKAKEDQLDLKMKEYFTMIENNASEQEINEKQAELEKLDRELREASEDYEFYLEMKEDELMNPIITDVNEALKSVNNNLGLNAIFQATNSDGVSFVLHAPDETEVTGQLLRETNSESASNFTTEYKSTSGGMKIGYTNVELVLTYMPEYIELNESLENYSSELTVESEAKSHSLYALNQEYRTKENAGSLSPNEQNNYERKIRSLSLELENLYEAIESNMETMKQERMDAILTKLQSTIDKVAIDNGFTLILNQTTSTGVSTILFGPEEGDITYVLLKELGANSEISEEIAPVSKGNLKVGFVNVEVVMGKMPEVEVIQNKVNIYTESIIEKQRGLAEVRSEEENQQAWAKAEQDVFDYRNTLLDPLLKQIQYEIDEIAKAEGYDYIINRTGDNVLQVAAENNVQSELMKALGVE